MNTPEQIRQLRRRFRNARRSLGYAAQAAHAEAAARAVANTRVLLMADVCGAYFTQDDGELDSLPLVSRLWAAGKTVGVPVLSGRGEMDFYQVKPDTPLVANRYGIPEPRKGRYLNPLSLSVLFMPLVAFDDQGNRLGMGAGYYDRYLGRLPSNLRPLLVGLAHAVQHSPDPLPRQSWDVPLDAVATEAGWRSLSLRASGFAGTPGIHQRNREV